ncbi:uncharacterized protein MELLADRAFT_67604 [Melampsora larici-populina 98AG31]|uniref:Secreted protein n=1 Tax=Melampsora larici-populina (strain 98AG31 / pathotype 3-4-7) TaxID=747676 RepID=F4S3R6_MELLP|nr:uncharacterized protein MELLADRAFT_67604 [Melampsora larici-populina 98AG31]EGG00720.1 secreted protein [Melampsora larici-populina 98AG31]
MQFGLKFFTLLALVALVGSTVGQPVANAEAAGETLLVKRWNQWNTAWGRNVFLRNQHWAVGTQAIPWALGLINKQPVGWHNGGWYSVPLNVFPNGVLPTNPVLPNFGSFINSGPPAGWF